MAQNQNPGMGNPMGPQRNPGDIASMLTAMSAGRPGGGVQPSGPPQGAPGQGPGGGKPQQIAGLQGGPKPNLGGAIGPYRPGSPPPGGPQQPIQWGGPPPAGGMQPGRYNMPPMGGPPPGGLQGAIQNLTSQGGAAGQQPNMWGTATMPPKDPNAPPPNYSNMPGMLQNQNATKYTQGAAPGQAGGGLQQVPPVNAALLQGRKMMGQGAPGQGAGGGKNQQMATLPGGPR